MGATTPDALPWPDFGDPGAVPTDMQELAAATQTALNARMKPAYSIGEMTSLTAGWAHQGGEFGNVRFYKVGKQVAAMGLLRRTSNLTVVDNNLYDLGDIPAGYRPLFTLYVPGAWVGKPTSTPRNYSVGHLRIASGGQVQFRPNFAGTIQADDWVSFGGLGWVTP